MFAERVEEFVSRRFVPLRAALVAVLAAGDLALMHRPGGAADWTLVAAAYGTYAAAARLPAPAVAALAVLLGAAEAADSAVLFPVKAMLAIALFELAVRRPAAELAAGAAAFAAAVAVGWIGDPPGDVAPALFRVAVFLTVLLLAGAYVRSARAAAREAAERAAADERAARAAERTAIARELHDLVAHHVSSMVLRVGVARHVLTGAEPRVRDVLDDLHATGTAALDDLGRLVAVLRDPATVRDEPPPVEPAALPAALARAVERCRAAGPAVEAAVDPAVACLDAMRGVTLLRLVQEGLANAARHAGPDATVRLSARVDGGAVRLVISDDGRGGPAVPGHGLTGMRERVDLLGGSFAAGPAGRGWRLTAELPPPQEVRA
ncbi:sensor histidine kinase [Actinomadura sediminis]|uniref:histidine kinase n=1 Tax=Actinomadura sediminis TaxID=1038904 RepID=A0ABW3F507_9ACTN